MRDKGWRLPLIILLSALLASFVVWPTNCAAETSLKVRRVFGPFARPHDSIPIATSVNEDAYCIHFRVGRLVLPLFLSRHSPLALQALNAAAVAATVASDDRFTLIRGDANRGKAVFYQVMHDGHTFWSEELILRSCRTDWLSWPLSLRRQLLSFVFRLELMDNGVLDIWCSTSAGPLITESADAHESGGPFWVVFD